MWAWWDMSQEQRKHEQRREGGHLPAPVRLAVGRRAARLMNESTNERLTNSSGLAAGRPTARLAAAAAFAAALARRGRGGRDRGGAREDGRKSRGARRLDGRRPCGEARLIS